MMDEELEFLRAEKMREMMDAHQEKTDLTFAFINAVEGALKSGVIHTDVHGKRLDTAVEICDALLRDGVITLEEPR